MSAGAFMTMMWPLTETALRSPSAQCALVESRES